MLSEATERRPVRDQNPMTTHPPPKASDSLPCPRCDSTSTKFCYYNNYNLSQPRYFCKSCRRYWTHGGTLRNIPVGGGCRKNSKRTRNGSASGSVSSSSSNVAASAAANSSSGSSTVNHERVAPPDNPEMGLDMATTDVNLNESGAYVDGSGSFTNMLNMQIQGQDFLGLGGFHEFGVGSGLEEFDLGFGTTRSWEIPGAGAGADSGCNTWQLMNGDDQGSGEDCLRQL